MVHKKRDIFLAANEGFAEISKAVENFDSDVDFDNDFDDADGEDADILVDFDTEYASLVRRGTPRARAVAVNTLTNRYGPRFTGAMNRRLSSLGSGRQGKKFKMRNLPFKTKRLSYNLVGVDLPFVYFAVNSLEEQYRSILNNLNLIDPSVTLQSVTNVNGDILFTYRSVSNSDLVDIVRLKSGNSVPYSTQLQMTRTSLFKSPGFKYTAQKGNFESQFNIDIFNGRQSLFGLTSDMSESTTSYKSVAQFQDAIINFSSEIEIDANEFLASAMSAVAPGPGLLGEIKWDVRVSDIATRNRKDVF